MALDTAESIAAVLREGPIFMLASTAYNAMPPVTPERPRKAVDFAPIIGAPSGSFVYKALDEFSGKVKKLSDIIDVLGLDPQGVFGLQIAALEILVADIQD